MKIPIGDEETRPETRTRTKMADDYLARTGAKEMLTNAVAALLEAHPTNPVAFLAHHFDKSGSHVVRCVRMVRGCPPHRTAFPDTVYRAFRLLRSEALPGPTGSVGAFVVSRPDYDQVLAALCADFPMHLQHRVLDSLRSSTGSPVPSQVHLREFLRGVQVCELLEELFDVVEELFTSVDRGRIGEVKLAVLLSALENAAQQSKQREIDEQALFFLKNCLHSRHAIPDISSGEALPGSPSKGGGDDPNRFMRLSELQEIIFLAVFTP